MDVMMVGDDGRDDGGNEFLNNQTVPSVCVTLYMQDPSGYAEAQFILVHNFHTPPFTSIHLHPLPYANAPIGKTAQYEHLCYL